MKQFFKFLMPIVALVTMAMPWNARAQMTLTVADGSATNSYVPVYGFYADAYLQADFVYPSADLVEMSGGVINSMTFFSSNSSVSWGVASFVVSMKEVSDATLTGFATDEGFTEVYSGSLSIAANGQMVVDFDTPYTYGGGDLLVRVQNTVEGSYVSCSWMGITATGSSYQGYSYSSLTDITGSPRNFLPKVEFDYAPGSGDFCFPVRNVTASGITSDGCTLSWTDTLNTGATYTVYDMSDTSVVGTTTSTTFTVSTLEANTLYQFGVVADCGSGTVSNYAKTTVRTACGGSTAVPYTEDFESTPDGEMPNCWMAVMTGTSGSGTFPSVYHYAYNAHNGNVYFELESTSGETEVAALPVMDNVSNLKLVFWASAMASYLPVLEVGVMEDTVFVPTDTITLTTSYSWGSGYRRYVAYFDDYTGTGDRLALRTTGTAGSQYTLMLDDFEVTLADIPEITSMPASLSTNINTDLAITATVGGNMAIGTYTWTSNMADAGNATMTAADNVLTINYSVAGTDTVTLIASNSYGADTAYTIVHARDLSPVTELPYSTGFEETDDVNWTLISDSVNVWVIGTATNNTVDGTTSMYISNDGGTTNGYTVNMATNSYAIRYFQLDEAGEYALSFDWHCEGEISSSGTTIYDYLTAFVAPDTADLFSGTIDHSNWTDLTGRLAGQSTWQSFNSTFNIATPGTYPVVFYWRNDLSTGNVPAAAVDNIVLSQLTCSSPQNFAVTTSGDTVNFTWTDALGSAWELVYGPTGFNVNTAEESVYPTTTSYELTDLAAGFYDAYLRTNCGTDNSFWVGPVSFSTGVTLMNMATSGTDTLHTCAAVIYDDGGAESTYSGGANATLIILPDTPGSDVVVSGSSYTESTYDYLTIYEGEGTDGEVLWTDYGVSSNQTFGPFTAAAITVTFQSDNYVNYSGFEIHAGCVAASTCPKPTHFVLTSVAADDVSVAWNEGGSASNWQLAIGNAGFNPDTTESLINVSDSSYSFTDLTGGVSYDIYVRADCGDEYSHWVGPLNVVPGQYIIGTSGSDIISMCNGVIYDDGGATGNYSNSADYTLVVYPSTPDSILTFSGSAYLESSTWDYLKIYEGIGTDGELLWQNTNTTQSYTIGPDTSLLGPITLVFHSDGSSNYSGFELFLHCVAAPACQRPMAVTATATSDSQVNVDINGASDGTYIIYWTNGTSTDSATVSGTTYTITGLTASTTYTITVARVCDDGSHTPSVSTSVHTQCVGGGCDLVIDMEDSYGDGWNGNAIVGFVNGVQTFTATLTGGYDGTYTYSMCNGDNVVLLWTSGLYSSETSFIINNGEEVVAADGDNYSEGDTIAVVNGCPSCMRPVSLTIDAIDTNQIDFHWTPMGTETSWEVRLNGAVVATVGTASYSATGLSNSTTYNIAVRAICGAGDTSNYLTGSAMTLIVPTALPYSTSFETGDDISWITANDANGWYIGTAAASVGTRGLYVSNDYGVSNDYDGTASSSYAYKLFHFETPGVYAVSFDWKGNGESGYDYLRAFVAPATATFDAGNSNGIGNSGTPTGWISLDNDYRLNLSDNWGTQAGIVNITSDTNLYVVFYWHNDLSVQNPPAAAVDNIEIGELTCPWPTNITVESVSDNSATISWTAGGSEGEWSVSLNGGTPVTVLDTFYTFTGLSAASNYTVSVRAHCSATDSSFATSDGFATLCGAVTLPWAEDFNSISSMSDLGCWERYNGLYDAASGTATLTETTSGWYHTTIAMDSSRHAKLNIYGSTCHYWLVTPLINLNVPATLSFDVALTDYNDDYEIDTTDDINDDRFFVLVSTDGGNNWTPAATWGNNLSNYDYLYGDIPAHAGENVSVSLADFTGNNVLIAFYGESTVSGGDNDLHIDNILVSAGGAYCNVPTITSHTVNETTANIIFTSPSDTNEVYIMPSPWVAPANGTEIYTTNHTFTGLTPSTQYTIGVRAVCGEGFYSVWELTTVTTTDHPCLVPTGVTVSDPTFEGATVSWTPGESENGWEVRVFCTSPQYEALYTVNNNPTFTVTGLDNGVTYNVTVRAMCGTDWYSEWSDTVTLTTASCPQVTGISHSNVTSTSATISWTGSANSYEIEYGNSGFPQGSGTTLTSATNSVNLTGLEELTTYDVYVRSVCADSVYSLWSTKHTFSTPEEGVGIDDVENGNVALYPNPASTTVTVSGIEGLSTVTVVDLNGRVVFRDQVGANGHTGSANAESSLTIDVSGYAKGAYFVRITGERTTAVRKLVVR